MLHDGSYFARCKGLAGRLIAHRLELSPELRAAANPSHQVVDRRARLAVGEIHQGEFLLGVRSYSEIIHFGFMFQVLSFIKN